MATATRSQTTYNTYATHVLEKWYNPTKAADIVFKATPTLQMLRSRAMVEPLPKDIAVRLLESKGEGFSAFHYYDLVSTAPSKGAQAALYHPSNFSIPLTMSWEEEMEFTSPQAFANRLKEYVAQQQLTMADQLSRALWQGTLVDANYFPGIFEMLAAYTQSGYDGDDDFTVSHILRDRWKARQQEDSYAGIQRAAYTADGVGGTGWEAITVDFGGPATSTANNIGLTSGAANFPFRVFESVYDMASWGIEHPHVIISNFGAYQDYGNTLIGKAEIQMTSTAMDGDLQFENRKFRGAMWFVDEYCKTEIAGAEESASYQNVVMLNLNRVKLLIDSRADMVLTMPRTPVDQHAGVRHMLLRGCLVTDNPRMHARIFDYPV